MCDDMARACRPVENPPRLEAWSTFEFPFCVLKVELSVQEEGVGRPREEDLGGNRSGGAPHEPTPLIVRIHASLILA